MSYGGLEKAGEVDVPSESGQRYEEDLKMTSHRPGYLVLSPQPAFWDRLTREADKEAYTFCQARVHLTARLMKLAQCGIYTHQDGRRATSLAHELFLQQTVEDTETVTEDGVQLASGDPLSTEILDPRTPIITRLKGTDWRDHMFTVNSGPLFLTDAARKLLPNESEPQISARLSLCFCDFALDPLLSHERLLYPSQMSQDVRDLEVSFIRIDWLDGGLRKSFRKLLDLPAEDDD